MSSAVLLPIKDFVMSLKAVDKSSRQTHEGFEHSQRIAEMETDCSAIKMRSALGRLWKSSLIWAYYKIIIVNLGNED